MFTSNQPYHSHVWGKRSLMLLSLAVNTFSAILSAFLSKIPFWRVFWGGSFLRLHATLHPHVVKSPRIAAGCQEPISTLLVGLFAYELGQMK